MKSKIYVDEESASKIIKNSVVDHEKRIRALELAFQKSYQLISKSAEAIELSKNIEEKIEKIKV